MSRGRAARADPERSNRLNEEFLAILSHELRNPMNAILGWATVLGREDDIDARELTTRILTYAGAKVIEAANAEAAFECFKRSGANFLLSDIGMAGTDGYQLVRSLRGQGFSAEVLPALALTAFARTQDRADALAAGFQDHLVKPIDPSTLVLCVSSLRRPISK